MLKEIITPTLRSSYDTDAQYNRAMLEKMSLIGFVLSVIKSLSDMRKEHAMVDQKKEDMLRAITPKTNRQALKFIKYVNRLALRFAKGRGGKACPHCGYYMFPIEQGSGDGGSEFNTSDILPSPMVINYCSMCGCVIERVYRNQTELDYIKAAIHKNLVKPMKESNRAHIRVRDALKEYGIDESEYYGDDDL